jgi:hypothetical protein
MSIDISGLEQPFLILNYFVLGAFFLYRYFRPEKWFVKSTVSFFLVWLLTILLTFTPFLLQVFDLSNIFLIVVLLVIIISIILIFKEELKEHGRAWVPPLGLYLLSVGQEVLYSADSPAASMQLLGWALFSPLFIAFFVPVAALFSRILSSVISKIPKIKDFPSSPSGFAVMGLAYVIWMLLRHIISGFA